MTTTTTSSGQGHVYDTTRTSPFGYYVTCACGWISEQYRPTAKDAWNDHVDHARQQAAAVEPLEPEDRGAYLRPEEF